MLTTHTVCLLPLTLLGLALATAPLSAMGSAPCGVIGNPGWLPEQVRAMGRCDGAVVYFTSDAVILDVIEKERAVWIYFAGASSSPGLELLGDTGTKVNYFIGNDPAHWRSSLRLGTHVVYTDLWPGVELEMFPEAGGLRLRVVAPSILDRSRIVFRFEGLQSGSKDVDSSLRWQSSSEDEVRLEANDDGTEAVIRWLEKAPSDDPGDSVSKDNPSSLLWSTFLGGADNEYAHGLTCDESNNPLVAGYTRSSTFPTTPGAYDRTLAGGYDIFVAKLDASGSVLEWATFIGGNAEDRPFAIVLDNLGNPIIGGLTYSSDFPTTPGAYDRTMGGSRDGYVCKLNSSGSALLLSSFLGGALLDRVWDLVLDDAGHPVIVGETYSPDFPTTAGAFDRVMDGLNDSYVAMLNPSTGSPIWSTFLGGSLTDQATSLGIDSQGRVIVTGNTASSDFPTTTGAYDQSHGGLDDWFVTALLPDGSDLSYSTFLGGSGSDMGNAIAVDHDDGVVVTGSTTSMDFPVTPFAFDMTQNGDRDVFVARLDVTGSRLLWGTYFGGDSTDEAFTLVLDRQNCPVISGEVSSANIPTTDDAFDRSYGGGTDAFLCRLDPSGATLLWSSYLGGSLTDGGWELHLDNSGRALLTGPTRSTNFPTTAGAYDQSQNGEKDVFVARFDAIGTVDAEGLASEGEAIRIWPNPFRSQVEARFDFPLSAGTRLIVTDVTGRRIAVVPLAMRSNRSSSFVWNGRDERNRPLAPGAYWLLPDVRPSVPPIKVVHVR